MFFSAGASHLFPSETMPEVPSVQELRMRRRGTSSCMLKSSIMVPARLYDEMSQISCQPGVSFGSKLYHVVSVCRLQKRQQVEFLSEGR